MIRKTTRYVAILEAEGPGTSRPILAIRDPETVEAVARIILARLRQEPDGSTNPEEGVEP